MQACSYLTMLLTFILLFPLLLIAQANPTLTWNFQNIDSRAGIDTMGIIAVDSNNYPHIVYRHIESLFPDTVFSTIYVSWNGSNWSNQTIKTKFIWHFI
jgi:hypothetical protein